MIAKQSLASALLLASAATAAQAAPAPYTGLVVFGDSYSDVGNLFVASTELQASTGQPVQPALDHHFYGRFSNGPIYTDVLAFGLHVALQPSLLGGGDYAFGGALNDSNVNELPPNGTGFYARGAFPWSLTAETQAFAAQAAKSGADPNALYVVFSGLNDVAAILQGRPGVTVGGTIGGILGTIETIKAAGGKTVLVPNLPDEGVLPVVTALAPIVPGISAAATGLTRQYNAALNAALDGVTGIRVIRFDTFSLIDKVVANPSRYGFVNATTPCYSGPVTPDPAGVVCADPLQYVFWDGQHPTTSFHILLGIEILRALYAQQ